jgi:hypothetical protein
VKHWEPHNQWRSIISQKQELSITVMWEPQHSPIHPHERCMEPCKQDLVETPVARMWKLCQMEVAWKLCMYIRVLYFVMLGFENLVEEFLHLWIFKVIPVYCWHKVRKIIIIECVWRLYFGIKVSFIYEMWQLVVCAVKSLRHLQLATL